jgi:hypothetical protein
MENEKKGNENFLYSVFYQRIITIINEKALNVVAFPIFDKLKSDDEMEQATE